jgi:hypothetical protein
MAKYSRFDPRNKKNNRHKSQSLEKDLKIKDVKTYVHSLSTMLEYNYIEGEIDEKRYEESNTDRL